MRFSLNILRISLYRTSYKATSNRSIVISSNDLSYVRLAEVGKFDVPKLYAKYETGQLFLHRVFGYRGVILFPWIAKVYDRDSSNKPISSSSGVGGMPTSNSMALGVDLSSTSSSSESSNNNTDPSSAITAATEPHLSSDKTTSTTDKPPIQRDDVMEDDLETQAIHSSYISEITKDNIKGSAQTYYQVLIDSRDCQFLKYTKKAQTEAVTFLGNQDNGRTLYAVPGLDYVSHEDIIPYTAVDQRPIHHELFYKFLKRVPDKDPPYEARDTLELWQKRNHPWLELSDVHKETTEGVRVTVIPFYMGCREAHSPQSNDVYWWRYCIRLENLGESTVQLRERHWRIFSLSGTLETVRGRGVVGSEPILTKRDPAFQYSSHVSLQSPSGHMWGTFRMQRDDGHVFECRIPPFSLESKQGVFSSPSPDTE
uniref:Polymerase delta-interacting protein 2-like isoform X1 n=2 Tax=Hirondellea gigas TaxID=1518452 RepID=A0A6A7FU64_9CRUS